VDSRIPLQMSRFKSRYREIEAVQWFPDSEFGSFDADGKYWNKSVGVDALGVQYSVCDVGIFTISGFANLKPGDWLIREDDGVHLYPCKPDWFALRWEPL
jgi:hypothetical protein